MLSPLKNLLVQLFGFTEESAASVSDAHGVQLATAVLLVEVMRSDASMGEPEYAAALSALRSKFALSDSEMQQLLSHAEHTAKHSSDFFRFTSAINQHFTHDQKIRVVEHMWQVAYADAKLDAHENHVISKVAGLLHVTHGEYIAAKLRAKRAAGLS